MESERRQMGRGRRTDRRAAPTLISAKIVFCRRPRDFGARPCQILEPPPFPNAKIVETGDKKPKNPQLIQETPGFVPGPSP
jgi:hypothetical protein